MKKRVQILGPDGRVVADLDPKDAERLERIAAARGQTLREAAVSLMKEAWTNIMSVN